MTNFRGKARHIQGLMPDEETSQELADLLIDLATAVDSLTEWRTRETIASAPPSAPLLDVSLPPAPQTWELYVSDDDGDGHLVASTRDFRGDPAHESTLDVYGRCLRGHTRVRITIEDAARPPATAALDARIAELVRERDEARAAVAVADQQRERAKEAERLAASLQPGAAEGRMWAIAAVEFIFGRNVNINDFIEAIESGEWQPDAVRPADRMEGER
jgi:hypothetical protein